MKPTSSFSALLERFFTERLMQQRRGCDNEHIDRCNVGQVVAQKATPSRGGDLGPPRQVSSDLRAPMHLVMSDIRVSAPCTPN